MSKKYLVEVKITDLSTNQINQHYKAKVEHYYSSKEMDYEIVAFGKSVPPDFLFHNATVVWKRIKDLMQEKLKDALNA